MKQRLTACLMAFIMAFAAVPAVLAADTDVPQEQAQTVEASNDIGSIINELPEGGGSFTTNDDAGSFKCQVLSQAEHEKALAEGEFKTGSYSMNYETDSGEMSQNYDADYGNFIAGKSYSFNTYGEQLPALKYTFSMLTKPKTIEVGTAMKKLYDNYMKDLAKGTSSACFNGNDSSIQKLGVTFTVPSRKTLGLSENAYGEVMYDFAWDIYWLTYRCVDMDSTDMFFSNGSVGWSYDYDYNGKFTGWFTPACAKQFETLSERKSWKTKLDSKVKSVVSQSNAYPTAYEKLQFFNKWLCDHNTYNDAAVVEHYDSNGEYLPFYYQDNVSGTPWSSVGALLSESGSGYNKNSPVCESYSRALQLLCSKVGIKATVVTSDQGNHMWSNVRYGDYWTGVDVTWNDDNYNPEQYFLNQVNNCDYYHVVDEDTFYGWFKFPSLSVISSKWVLPFYDVSSSFWGRKYVEYVYNRGYMSGMNCVTFGTNTAVTRAQFVQILYNMAGAPPVSYSPRFSDVPSGQWYTNAVMWAANNGLVNGNTNGTFGVNSPIKREDMTVILYKYRNAPPTSEIDFSSRFSDADEIDAYAVTALSWAINNGVISGNANGTLDPRGKATRTQCAVVINNIT